MKRLRQTRLRSRLSLLAMIALLWTQLSLANHPACTLASMVVSGGHAGMVASDTPSPADCHPAPSQVADISASCETHCSRSELASEASRVLSVPAIGPLPAPLLPLALAYSPGAPGGILPDRPWRSWHRPTAHPASLLLI